MIERTHRWLSVGNRKWTELSYPVFCWPIHPDLLQVVPIASGARCWPWNPIVSIITLSLSLISCYYSIFCNKLKKVNKNKEPCSFFLLQWPLMCSQDNCSQRPVQCWRALATAAQTRVQLAHVRTQKKFGGPCAYTEEMVSWLPQGLCKSMCAVFMVI